MSNKQNDGLDNGIPLTDLVSHTENETTFAKDFATSVGKTMEASMAQNKSNKKYSTFFASKDAGQKTSRRKHPISASAENQIQIDISPAEETAPKIGSKGERSNDTSIMKEHSMKIDDVIMKLESDANLKNPLLSKGLSNAKAELKLINLGRNETVQPKRRGIHLKFFETLSNLFNILLFSAGALYLLLFAIQPINNFESIWIGCTLILVGVLNAAIEVYEMDKVTETLRLSKVYHNLNLVIYTCENNCIQGIKEIKFGFN